MNKIKVGCFIPVTNITNNRSIIKGYVPSKYNNRFERFKNYLHDVITTGVETPILSTEETLKKLIDLNSRFDKYGIIDGDGNIILDLIYDNIIVTDPKYNFRYVLLYMNNKWSIYDLDKNILLWDDEFDDISRLLGRSNDAYSVTYKYIAVCKNNKWGFLDYNCDLIIPYMYDAAFSSINENYMYVKENNKYCVIDKNNNVIAKDLDYDEIWEMDKNFNYFLVRKLTSEGVIDRNNNVIIPLDINNFKTICQTNCNLMGIKKNLKWGVYSLSGNQIVPPIFDELIILDANNIVGQKDNFVYHNNKLIFDNAHHLVQMEGDNYFIIVDNDENQILFDKKGHKIFGGRYKNIYIMDNGNIFVFDDVKFRELDINGNLLKEYPEEINGIFFPIDNNFFAILGSDFTIFDKNNNNLLDSL
ncbi:MAG: WG repeat-containing protein [Bacilli bacterium]|nr:WG repeat-containing protein [Bacilli bacterium]